MDLESGISSDNDCRDSRTAYDRPLRNLRLSVTDRCNLRCSYCMPEPDYVWLPREDILQFEEIETLVDVFVGAGRGQGPADRRRAAAPPRSARPDAAAGRAAGDSRPGDDDQRRAAGGAHAPALRDAGLHRLTVSLDTLRPERFRDLTRFDELDRVLEGIDAAAPLFPGLKIDTVVIRGVNDDELVELIEFGRAPRRRSAVHRIHGRRRRDALVDGARGVARARCSTRLEAHYGPVTPLIDESSRAGRSLPPARRHGVRHHLVDDRAVLRDAIAAA